MDSILTSIKKLLGIAEEYTQFDMDIIKHINTVFMILTQIGVGPPEGFSITGADETWDKFLSGSTNLEGVKTYVYMKVQLMFDPPTSSAKLDSANRVINELEWRLNLAGESNS